MTGLGVYVHVPFCASRCHYCDFVTVTGHEGQRELYIDAVLAEAELAWTQLERESLHAEPIISVFVGGGTPTLLGPQGISRLLQGLAARLPLASCAEITVEANPETVDDALTEALVSSGVTRVSLGVQSMDARVLHVLGRGHGPQRVLEATETLRAGGVHRLNLDVIYGSPSESDQAWRQTLQTVLEVDPEHVSAYALTIEPATRFGRMVAVGALQTPPEDLLADRYTQACTMLAGAGYRHYEVSNWAKGLLDAEGLPKEVSRHNLGYWQRRPYIGLGVGAHEQLGRERRWNTRGLRTYLETVARGARAIDGREVLDASTEAFEEVALALRLSVGLDEVRARQLGVRLEAVDELRLLGLLEPGPRLRPTERGMLLHGELVSRLAA